MHDEGKSKTCESGFCTTTSIHCMSVPQPRSATGTERAALTQCRAISECLTFVLVALVVHVRALRFKVPQRAQDIGERVHIALWHVSMGVLCRGIRWSTYTGICSIELDEPIGLCDRNASPAQATLTRAGDVEVDLFARLVVQYCVAISIDHIRCCS